MIAHRIAPRVATLRAPSLPRADIPRADFPRGDIPRTGADTQLLAAFWGFGALTVLLLISPFSRSLLILFPAFSVVIAGFALYRSRPAYAGLVCWLWMLSPLVRRLVDYRAGWIPATAVLLAPLLATGVPVIPLLARWKTLLNRSVAPLLFIVAAVFYGLAVGVLLRNQLQIIVISLMNWLIPLFFALFLFRNREIFPALYEAIENAFVRGLLLVSVYGIYQYFFLPAWDAAWMENSGLVSIGIPAPLQVRVFSTLNSPQTLGAFLVVGLIFAFQSRSRLRFAALPAGLLTLGLTLSRSAWIGLLAAVIYLFLVFNRRQRLVLAVIAGVCIGMFAVAFQIPEVSGTLERRLASLTDPGGDVSLNSRSSGYGVIFGAAVDSPFGQGIGFSENDPSSPGEKGTSGLGQGDSSIVGVLFNFGLPGTVIFSIALLLILRIALSAGNRRHKNMLAPAAIFLSLLVEAPFVNVMTGAGGFLIWTAAGLCIVMADTALDTAKPPAAAI